MWEAGVGELDVHAWHVMVIYTVCASDASQGSSARPMCICALMVDFPIYCPLL